MEHGSAGRVAWSSGHTASVAISRATVKKKNCVPFSIPAAEAKTNKARLESEIAAETQPGGYPGGLLNPANAPRALYTGNANASDAQYNAARGGGGESYTRNAGNAHTALKIASDWDPTPLSTTVDATLTKVEVKELHGQAMANTDPRLQKVADASEKLSNTVDAVKAFRQFKNSAAKSMLGVAEDQGGIAVAKEAADQSLKRAPGKFDDAAAKARSQPYNNRSGDPINVTGKPTKQSDVPSEWKQSKNPVDSSGKRIKGKWMSPKEYAGEKANNLLGKWREAGVGQGARSGQHGVPYSRAASELRQMAKDKNLLPEVQEEPLKKAQQCEQRAREINHPMR